MCTVTFLPVSKSEYLLTSNRDEKVGRASATFPFRQNGTLFPKDEHSGGTWIATSSNGKSICLLNGALTKHKHAPPYRHSRGLIVLKAFTYPDFKSFAANIDLTEIEPFTLVMVENEGEKTLFEFMWDGQNRYFAPLEPEIPHFWCSVTLYAPEVYERRKKWFEKWILDHHFNLDGILHFHQFGGDGNPANDLVINRNDYLKTLSITSIHRKEDQTYMTYMDLQKKVSYQEWL